MTQFNADEKEHTRTNIIFDNSEAVDKLKQHDPKLAFSIVRGKDKDRLKNMVEELVKSNQLVYTYQNNAISFILMAQSELDVFMKLAGLPVQGKKVGVTICKDCLDRTINLTEEKLNILKDIKDSLK